MAVCDHEYNEETMKLRINCVGCIYGASVEDFDVCMAKVIDKILEVKKVRTLVLAKDREYEYPPEQTRLLVEVADTIDFIAREGLLSKPVLISAKCQRCYPEMNSNVQRITLNLLRRDPVGAYVETVRELREVRTNLRQASKACLKCFMEYKRILEVIRQRLGETGLIRLAKPHLAGYHIGDRSLYRNIFMPTVRPNFMLTRYMITPPEKGYSIDRYGVGDTRVEIFRLPNVTQYFYYTLPPEFALSEEKYSVLDAARRYMATHKPKAEEFVRSKRIREIFYNIGRDMIRDTAGQMGIKLGVKDVDQLANILTRYTAGMGVLEVLLSDEKIQDIYINSPVEGQSILIFHQDWEECKTNLMPTMEDAETWATRLRIQSGRPLDEANPVLDTEVFVPGGRARFAVITRTLSPYGIGFAIRRHRDRPWTLPLFIKNNMMSPLAGGLLSFLVDGAVSMLIAGGRSAGKTSVLASLMLEILPKLRIISLEDTLELPVNQLRELGFNIESLKSRSVITQVETEMAADEALRTSLRLGDSALIVGEVRSLEARSLYEAMRIGALSNIVAGTIHGESAYGVFDRVVNDLNVPPTSFKATDIIPICKMLRSADGLHRFRRMTEIVEVRKEWDRDPSKEGGFVNLMEYSGKKDMLEPTPTLINGESEVLNRIASYVREWSGNWDAVWENINLRARIKQSLIEMAEKANRPEILEAEWIVKSNNEYHLIQEAVREEAGASDPKRIYSEWLKWAKAEMKVKGV